MMQSNDRVSLNDSSADIRSLAGSDMQRWPEFPSFTCVQGYFRDIDSTFTFSNPVPTVCPILESLKMQPKQL